MKLTRSGWIIVQHPITGEQHTQHYEEREAIERAAGLGRRLGRDVTIKYDLTVLVEIDSDAPPPEPDPPPAITGGYPLRGDAAFNADSLDDINTDENGVTLRGWHDNLLTAAASGYYDSDFDRPIVDPANREGNMHVTSFLLALRLLGNLAFLDEACRLVELWYAHLTPDENGRLRHDDGSTSLEARLQGGLIARVMYACHENRDLSSPAGFDYGDIADRYHAWLMNHHLPRWRDSDGAQGPVGIDYGGSTLRHAYTHELGTFYYCWKKLHDEGSPSGGGFTTAEWKTQSDWSFDFWFDQVVTNCPHGHDGRNIALFRHTLKSGASNDTAAGMHFHQYTRYTYAAIVDLWADRADARLNETFMTQVASGLEDLGLDEQAFDELTLAATMAGDLGYGDTMCGLPGNRHRRPVAAAARWHSSCWPLLEAWASRGRAIRYGVERHAEASSADVRRFACYPVARVLTNRLRGWA